MGGPLLGATKCGLDVEQGLMDMSTDDAAGFKFHDSTSVIEGISVADITGTRSASWRDTTSYQLRSVAASNVRRSTRRQARGREQQGRQRVIVFVSGSSTDFTPALISAHISRERTLNRTIWKYVATFKVYFRTSISEKSNPGE
jgi:hypothetical protein